MIDSWLTTFWSWVDELQKLPAAALAYVLAATAILLTLRSLRITREAVSREAVTREALAFTPTEFARAQALVALCFELRRARQSGASGRT